MTNAIIVITHLWNTDFAHWWHLYFDPAEKVWYEGAVWGNIFAILPAGVLGAIAFFWHGVLVDEAKKAADQHTRHLKKILDALDPESDGGVHIKLDQIVDDLDPKTDSGIGVIIHKLENPTLGS